MAGRSTTCVHGGEHPDPHHGALNTPIVQSSTYRFPERADGSPAPYIYSRYDNPTLEAVEERIQLLEGADGALLFASGMAAIHAATSSLRPGDVLAVQEGVYGGSTALFEDHLAPAGIEVRTIKSRDAPHAPPGTAAEPPDIPSDATMVWCESITNPLLRVTDIPAWAEATHAIGARLAVDATFATPILQRPIQLGADLVVHSATKYLGGHADVTGGVVVHKAADRDALWRARRNFGATLDPHAAFLIGRGIKTLALRMERHCHNAHALAQALAAHADVQGVLYPGLEDHPDHDRIDGLLERPGGMVTIDVGRLEAAQAFRRSLQTIVPGASLGGVESLASLPLETSHAYATDEARQAMGIRDGLVRISVGIEDVEDLILDCVQALEKAGA